MKNIGNGTFAYMPNMGANGEDLDITAETIDGGAFFADGNLQGGSSHTVSDDTIHYSSIILNGVKNITGQAIFSDVQAKILYLIQKSFIVFRQLAFITIMI